jgi:hypothetical protein
MERRIREATQDGAHHRPATSRCMLKLNMLLRQVGPKYVTDHRGKCCSLEFWAPLRMSVPHSIHLTYYFRAVKLAKQAVTQYSVD